MATVAFIGLGNMGYPMAGHLLRAGHAVTVYNRTAAKAERWVREHGGARAESPAAAAAGAEFVFTCVGNDDDLREVVSGPRGVLTALAAGSVVVDHTTTSASVARELAPLCAARGVGFVDAPVSGGQAGAQNGVLTVMCGGEHEHFSRAEPVIAAFARSIVLIGPSGAGQLTKMVNQVCIAGVLQGLAEGLVFGQRAGLDMEKVIAVISKGAAQSWQMDNRAATMCRGEYDFGFAVDWMRKDLGIVLDESRRNGAPLPVTTLIDGYYAELQRQGRNRADTSSLVEILRAPSKL
ncbi:MAG: NAD(P)-dependent oxidoreductase [Gammaproteobacteria bacterium]|nr:NAD(P)-dependent oxidoreductase [Gammaproteobacteria bacterium]